MTLIHEINSPSSASSWQDDNVYPADYHFESDDESENDIDLWGNEWDAHDEQFDGMQY